MAQVAGAARAPAERSAERSIDWRQVRLVLGTRWRILLRGASGSRWKLVFTVLGWTLFAAFLGAITVGLGFAAAWARGHAQYAEHADAGIHVLFLLSLVSLAVTPALGLRGNEFLDVTKLFTLPVSHRTVFAASLAALVVSPGAVFLTLPLAGAVVGWGGSVPEVLGGLLAVLGVALVGVAIGQIGLLLFLDVFKSRKWRDLSRLVVVLLSAGVATFLRVGMRDAMGGGLQTALATFHRIENWMLPLPSWWGAHAVTGDGFLRWLPALALPLLVAWLVAVAARLQERAYFSEIEERHDVAAGPSGGIAGWLGRRLPGALGGTVEKDVRILLRDPALRILLIQQFAYSVAPLAISLFQTTRTGVVRPAHAEWLLYAIAQGPTLFATILAFNPLGSEGAGIQHALLGPMQRRTILVAKSLALVAVVGAGLGLLSGAATFVVAMVVAKMDSAAALVRALLALVEAPLAYAVMCGVGSVFGAYFPTRAVSRDRRAVRQMSMGSGGCLRSMAGFATFLVAVCLMAPVGLAFHHPAISRLAFSADSTALLAVTVPAAALYAAFLVWAGSRLGGAALAAREEATLDALTKSDQ